MKKDDLYRSNVGIMVVNNEHNVLVCKRGDISQDHCPWQMPQGGIDFNEEPELAGLRELEEETNIKPYQVEKIDFWNEYQYYEFSQNTQKPHLGFIGQKQKWLVVKYLESNNSVDISKADHNEFCDYKWVNINEAIDLIWEPKKHIYKALKQRYNNIL